MSLKLKKQLQFLCIWSFWSPSASVNASFIQRLPSLRESFHSSELDGFFERDEPLTQNSCFSSFADIDECSTAVHSCVSLATCYNTDGGYNCTCKTGFNGDGMTSCTGEELTIDWTCLHLQKKKILGISCQTFIGKLSFSLSPFIQSARRFNYSWLRLDAQPAKKRQVNNVLPPCRLIAPSLLTTQIVARSEHSSSKKLLLHEKLPKPPKGA